MRAQPLVSVMMPCFNSAATLPMAVGSLLAQTHTKWEAVIVDDGSTDDTWSLLNSIGDPRLRCERFDRNQGRGAARQRCLAMAQGDYLAFVDSDDWLFPDKLKRQVKSLEGAPDVSIVSTATIITDGPDDPVGLSKLAAQCGDATGTFTKPGPPPLEFPSSMIRMDVAKRGSFDPAFLRSQDSDFLIGIMLGRKYMTLPEPLYAYSQASAATLEKTLEGYSFRLRCYRKYRSRYPFTVARRTAQTWARILAYHAFGALGAEDHLIRRRWDDLSPDAERAFREAFEHVSAAAREIGLEHS